MNRSFCSINRRPSTSPGSGCQRATLGLWRSRSIRPGTTFPGGPRSMPVTSWRSWVLSWRFWGKRGQRLDVPLGQCSGSHHRQGDRLDGGHGHQAHWIPTVFTRSCPGSLLLVSKGQESAGQPHPHPGYVQEGEGGGCAKYHGGGLRRDVPAMVSVPGELCCDGRQIRWEKLKIQLP